MKINIEVKLYDEQRFSEYEATRLLLDAVSNVINNRFKGFYKLTCRPERAAPPPLIEEPFRYLPF
jgi:hypothetical protein